VENIVTNVHANFNDDRLWNERILVLWKSDNNNNPKNNNKNNVRSRWGPVSGSKNILVCRAYVTTLLCCVSVLYYCLRQEVLTDRSYEAVHRMTQAQTDMRHEEAIILGGSDINDWLVCQTWWGSCSVGLLDHCRFSYWNVLWFPFKILVLLFLPRYATLRAVLPW